MINVGLHQLLLLFRRVLLYRDSTHREDLTPSIAVDEAEQLGPITQIREDAYTGIKQLNSQVPAKESTVVR